jgi:hypothetical protein
LQSGLKPAASGLPAPGLKPVVFSGPCPYPDYLRKKSFSST